MHPSVTASENVAEVAIWTKACRLKVAGTLILALLLQGCSSRVYISEEKMSASLAQYAASPPNKAMYMFVPEDRTLAGSDGKPAAFRVFRSWDGPDLQSAMQRSQGDCASFASSLHQGPETCIPVALNNRQVLDYSVYFLDPAEKLAAEQRDEDLSQAIGTALGSAITRHRK